MLHGNDGLSSDRPPLRRILGIGVVLLSSVLISLAPIAAKTAYQEGANPLAVITYRTLIGMVVLAIYLTLRQQWWKNGWAPFRYSSVSGAAQAFTSVGFLGAVAYIDVSLAALIVYFHPFVVAAVGHFRGDVNLTPVLIAYIGTTIVGLALVFGVSFESLNFAGISLSLIGMVAVTVLILTVAHSSQSIGPIVANFNMTAWASMYFLLIVLIEPQTGFIEPMVYPSSVKGWFAVIGAGVTTTLGFVLFFVGAAMIGTTRATVLSMSEPLLTILLAILLVQEWLTGVQWVGVALVISSLLLFEATEKNTSA